MSTNSLPKKTNEGEQNRFTSLSTLGAEAPLSPTDMNGIGNGSRMFDGVRSSWLKRPLEYITEFASLISPENEGEGEEIDQDFVRRRNGNNDIERNGSSSTSNRFTNVTERTPLIQNTSNQPREPSNLSRTSNVSRKTRKYIGGGCVCDPLGKITTVQPSIVAIDENQDGGLLLENQCRTCEDASRIARHGVCFGYGTVPASSSSFSNGNHNREGLSALSLAALSQVCFATMSLLSATLAKRQSSLIDSKKEKGSSMDALQMLTWQSIIISMICIIIILFSPKARKSFVRQSQSKGSQIWIWCRSLLSCLTGISFVIAAQSLKLSDIVSILYLAPIIYSCTSHLVFTPRHPFRAQLVSLSLWLGLILMIQPGFIFGYYANDGTLFEDQTIAATPLDLPGLISSKLLNNKAISYQIGCIAIAGCGLTTLLTMALFDQKLIQRPKSKNLSIYQSVLISSILTIPLSVFIRWSITKELSLNGFMLIQDSKTILLFFSLIVFSFLARIFQDLAMIGEKNKTGSSVCQLGLISFLQPLLSTGLDLLFTDLVGDVLSLFGCLLISVNLAWIASPEEGEEEEEEMERNNHSNQ